MSRAKYVITITRQFGSLGRPIAKKMAELLDIGYYDREIVDQAASKLKLPVSVVDDAEEKASKKEINPFFSMKLPLGRGTTDMQNKIFEAQKNIIEFLAEKETCIIVGRCSDFILDQMENAMHVYIYSPYGARLKNCIESLQLEESVAKKTIADVDEARKQYHMEYAGYLPDDKSHKDILIDSSFLGVDGTAEYLAEAARRKFGV